MQPVLVNLRSLKSQTVLLLVKAIREVSLPIIKSFGNAILNYIARCKSSERQTKEVKMTMADYIVVIKQLTSNKEL